MTTQLVMAFTLARWLSSMKWPRYRYSVEVNACARLQEAAPESTQAHGQEERLSLAYELISFTIKLYPFPWWRRRHSGLTAPGAVTGLVETMDRAKHIVRRMISG